MHIYDCLVIGSGAAGLNAADSLCNMGVTNIAIITEALYSSTSINTGSDKQTYYKLSTTGDQSDSVYDMAQTYYNCGGMEGHHALTEAALSLRCFFKLCEYGVPFPTNDYGEYVGYRTDHDTRRRASSCGPLTSKYMCEALIRKVKQKNIEVIESKRVVKLLCEGKKVCGCVAIDIAEGDFTSYAAKNIILACGGPAGIYCDSVYPTCQTGGIGTALEIGAKASSLCEWQYGLASTDFRWNLSGSYQQVIPKYVSVDNDGNIYEFLGDYIDTNYCDLIFQKGYNWPFTPKNLGGKSSLVDIAVYTEEKIKGRRVYMDFRANPKHYDFDKLCTEAKEYFVSSNMQSLGTPIQRLKKLNLKAYNLYLDNGIDLENQPLRISVCAQHCNGGLWVDKDYMTSVENLYACGECAGVFGVTRPGGSALNSTQVSSLKAAMSIAKNNVDFDTTAYEKISKTQNQALLAQKQALLSGGNTTPMDLRQEFSSLMTKYGAFIRKQSDISTLIPKIATLYEQSFTQTSAKTPLDIANAFVNRDLLLTALAVLESERFYAMEGYTSRGGYIVMPQDTEDLLSFCKNVPLDTRDHDVVDVKNTGSTEFQAQIRTVCPIPQSEQWFEAVLSKQ